MQYAFAAPRFSVSLPHYIKPLCLKEERYLCRAAASICRVNSRSRSFSNNEVACGIGAYILQEDKDDHEDGFLAIVAPIDGLWRVSSSRRVICFRRKGPIGRHCVNVKRTCQGHQGVIRMRARWAGEVAHVVRLAARALATGGLGSTNVGHRIRGTFKRRLTFTPVGWFFSDTRTVRAGGLRCWRPCRTMWRKGLVGSAMIHDLMIDHGGVWQAHLRGWIRWFSSGVAG